MPRGFTAFDILAEQPETGFQPEFLSSDYVGDRGKAQLDAEFANRILRLGRKFGADHHAQAAKKGPLKFEGHIEQVGDAVGIDGLGKNFVVKIDLSNPAWWCKDPRYPKIPPNEEDVRASSPVPRNTHPAIKLGFNMRNINVQLKDMGTMDKPEDRVLWDVRFGVKHSTKDIDSRLPPDGGDMPRMLQICPKPGEVHKYQLNLSGQDHRRNPPKGRERGLDETVVFEGQMLPEGHLPKRVSRPPGPPHHTERDTGGPLDLWTMSGPNPLFAALLPPLLIGQRQGPQKHRCRQRVLVAATFL